MALVTQMVKNLPVVRETRVRSLSQEDPIEKGMATHSSILAWRIPLTEEPGGLQSMGSQRVRHNLATNPFTSVADRPSVSHIQTPERQGQLGDVALVGQSSA